MAHHNKIVDLNGWLGKYFKVTGINPIPNASGVKCMWECLCTCGRSFYAEACRIKSGRRKSCGCKSKEYRLFVIHETPLDAAWARLYGIYKRGAEKRDLVFELELDYFKSLCSSACFYCKAKESNLIHGLPKKSVNYTAGTLIYNGIDRINSSLGYVIGNVRSCCRRCNVSKGTMSETEFKEHIVRLYWGYAHTSYESGLD